MYNKVIAVGNLTRDIEIKYLPNNTPLAKGAIATSYKYKTQSGEQKEEVCFLDFTIFGRVAEVANQYLHKGSKVMLDGRLQFDQWVDNQTGAKRSKHSLMVNEMKMLDSKSEASYQPQMQTQGTPQPNNTNTPIINADEIPSDPNDWNLPTINIQNDEIPF